MGRLVHFEIHAQNPEKMSAFYQKIFGWSINQWGPTDYWLITTGDKSKPGIDGVMLVRKGPKPEEGAPVNAFVCTIESPAIDADLEKVIKEGGTIALPKMAVAGVAWLAYCKDPEGNIFGITQNDTNAK